MYLKLCLRCGHPLLHHERGICTEVPDYELSDISEDGTVPACPCAAPLPAEQQQGG